MTVFDTHDPFLEQDSSARAFREIFSSRGGRVGRTGARPKAGTAVADLEVEEAPEAIAEEGAGEEAPQDKAPIRLSNPQWGCEAGSFNEKAMVSVAAELPPESGHLTRVTFTLYAHKDGQTERIDAREAHVKDGKAAAEMTLWMPHLRDEAGNLLGECDYVFTAKHRDGPEIESGKLKVEARDEGPAQAEVPPTTIEVVLLKEGNLPRAGEKYVLTDAAGKVFQGVTDKDGRLRAEGAAPGEATVKFPDLEKLAGTASLVEAGAGGKSSFYLRIQMDPEEAKRLEEKFILASGDGSFRQEKTVADDLILGDNFIDLRFTDIPIELAYTLRIEAKGKPPYVLFADVPFLKLDGFAG